MHGVIDPAMALRVIPPEMLMGVESFGVQRSMFKVVEGKFVE